MRIYRDIIVTFRVMAIVTKRQFQTLIRHCDVPDVNEYLILTKPAYMRYIEPNIGFIRFVAQFQRFFEANVKQIVLP